MLVFSNSSNESSFGASPAKVCTDVGVLEIIELLLLPLIDDSGFVSTKLLLFEEDVLVPMKRNEHYIHRLENVQRAHSFHSLLTCNKIRMAIFSGWHFILSSSFFHSSWFEIDNVFIQWNCDPIKIINSTRKNSIPILTCQLPSSVRLFFLLVLWSFECESDDELKLVVISSWKTPIDTVFFVMHYKNKYANLFINWPLPW